MHMIMVFVSDIYLNKQAKTIAVVILPKIDSFQSKKGEGEGEGESGLKLHMYPHSYSTTISSIVVQLNDSFRICFPI